MKWTNAIKGMIIASLIYLAIPVAFQARAQTALTPGPAREIAALTPCIRDFKAMDKNHDGKVTKEEFMAVPRPGQDSKALFDSLDTNRVGYLTTQEYCIIPFRKCLDKFRAMDKNLDGQIDKEEFMSVPHPGQNAEALFKSLDKNGNGYLTKNEWEGYCADTERNRGSTGY